MELGAAADRWPPRQFAAGADNGRAKPEPGGASL